jgi:hypothetical protein
LPLSARGHGFDGGAAARGGRRVEAGAAHGDDLDGVGDCTVAMALPA